MWDVPLLACLIHGHDHSTYAGGVMDFESREWKRILKHHSHQAQLKDSDDSRPIVCETCILDLKSTKCENYQICKNWHVDNREYNPRARYPAYCRHKGQSIQRVAV